MKNEGVKSVAAKHIEAGIQKYGGVIDDHLASIIKAAGFQFTPYRFLDGRILLVMPNNLGGFLYRDKNTLYDTLVLSE